MSVLSEISMNIPARALRLLLAGSLAFSCLAAWSDDAAIRRSWNQHNPKGPQIDEITKTPIAGLFELRVGSDIIYSDDQGNYLIYPSRDSGNGPAVRLRRDRPRECRPSRRSDRRAA